MSKTPFEIRADVLKQSQDLLEKQYDSAVKLSFDIFFDAVKRGACTMEQLIAATPKFPTSDEVIAQAKKFSAFVNGDRV